MNLPIGKQFLRLYNLLQKINTSKIISLNRIVALARAEDPGIALDELVKLKDEKLDAYYLYHAIRAGILIQLKKDEQAKEAYLLASELADNQLEKVFLKQRGDSL